VPNSLKRALLVGALAAGAVALAMALAWDPPSGAPAGPSTGYRVIVVAVDGLDGYLVTRLVEQGRLPTFRQILARATTGQVVADDPPVPLAGWTRLVTGRALAGPEAERAGAGGRLFSLPPDLALAVREAGGRTVMVGWPGSWPVGPDAANEVAPYLPASESHERALAPALFEDAPGQVPAALDELVRGAVAGARSSLDAATAQVLGADPAGTGPEWREAVATLRWSLEADMATVETAAKLIAREDPHLALVYLGGLDAASHRFLPAAVPAMAPALPPGSEAYSGVLERYHGFLDAALDRLRALGGETTWLVVCSVYGTRPLEPGDGPPSATHGRGAPGVLILHGRDATSTPVPLSVTTLDVAPTLLALLGVPIPESMEGAVVDEALPQGLLERHPVTRTGRVGRGDAAASVDAELERRMDALVADRLTEMREAAGARP
jgi:hypothetical protein